MTLRAAYALAGAATFLPAVAFLILFRPPHTGTLRSRMRYGENVGVWWIASSLRLLAVGFAATGFRIMTTNILNGDKPVMSAGWFDKITALITIFLVAGAANLFLLVYLAFRIWPAEDPEEEQQS